MGHSRAPSRGPTKAQQKAVSILTEVLKDGREHTSEEIHAMLKEHGSSHRYLAYARKALGADLSGGGKAGPVTYRLCGFKHHEQAPDVSRSSEILTKKAPVDTQNLREKLSVEVPGYDPLVSMAVIAQDPTVPLSVRLEIHTTLAKYLVPQVKATEITSNDQPIALNFKWQQ